MKFKYNMEVHTYVPLTELTPTTGIANRVYYHLIEPVRLGKYTVNYAGVYKYKNNTELQCVLREQYDKPGVSYPLQIVMDRFPDLLVDLTNSVTF